MRHGPRARAPRPRAARPDHPHRVRLPRTSTYDTVHGDGWCPAQGPARRTAGHPGGTPPCSSQHLHLRCTLTCTRLQHVHTDTPHSATPRRHYLGRATRTLSDTQQAHRRRRDLHRSKRLTRMVHACGELIPHSTDLTAASRCASLRLRRTHRLRGDTPPRHSCWANAARHAQANSRTWNTWAPGSRTGPSAQRAGRPLRS